MDYALSDLTRRRSVVAATFGVVAIAAGALVADVSTPADYYPPVLYVLALVLCVWVGSTRFLWGFVAVALVLTWVDCYPAAGAGGRGTEFWINRGIVAVVLLSVAFISDRLVRLLDAYRRRGAELEAANRMLADASARKTRFMAAISHDIRTPATAIGLLARSIRHVQESDPARVADLTARLESNAVALTELLTDMLDVARFDADAVMDLQESEFPLSHVLEDGCRRLYPLAEVKGLQLALAGPSLGIVLRTDRTKLSRVLGNLVENGIKFTDEGCVSVETRLAADGSLQLQVADTGRGIEPGHLTRIFDEFFQVRRDDRDRGAGRGLGLATCRRLIEAMGGTLAVESRVAVGTTFTITIPASRVLTRRSVAPSGTTPPDRVAAL